MIEQGTPAPALELPAAVGGGVEQVALADALEAGVAVLAFYPGDFAPAEGEAAGLEGLDALASDDVAVLGISGDSVYSHRRFAREADLQLPLLADVHGEAAAAYGVDVADPAAGYPIQRAVVVVDSSGEVAFAWSAADPAERPPVDRVRAVLAELGAAVPEVSLDGVAGGEAIDDDELEEITAELEAEGGAIRESEMEWGAPGGETAEPDADAEVVENDVELDLTDPTDGEGLDPIEDEEERTNGEDLGDGDHGVPDSL